jgi:hypothetical protein
MLTFLGVARGAGAFAGDYIKLTDAGGAAACALHGRKSESAECYYLMKETNV